MLTLPMAYAGILGVLNWQRIEFRNTGHKIAYGLSIFYIAGSIPCTCKPSSPIGPATSVGFPVVERGSDAGLCGHHRVNVAAALSIGSKTLRPVWSSVLCD
ncbi:MAG: hypothetical protein R2932_45590 [Caldilineaceae bacterium]